MNELPNCSVIKMPSFSDRVREEMERQGITPAEMARRTGLSKPTIGAIIRGDTPDPRFTSVLSIAKVLGCDPIQLFTGRGSAEYVASTNINRIPVWQVSDMNGKPHDAFPLLDTGRSLIAGVGGHLCGVVAPGNELRESGITAGDICIIDMALSVRDVADGDVVLVDYKGSVMLLRVSNSLHGKILVVDDPRFGSIPIADASVLGKMTSLHRDH